MRLSLSAASAALSLLATASLAAPVTAPAANPVRIVGQTLLPGYTGDFDHFAIDAKDRRLFLAGEEHGSLEVFDLRTGAHLKSLPGFEAPHSLLYLPKTGELVVIADAKSRVLDAATLAPKRPLALGAGADSMAYDAPRRRAYVVTGGKDVDMTTGALVEIDLYTGKIYGETKLDGDHTEALVVEQAGGRIFINQTDKNLLDIVDKRSHAITARWPITAAAQNAPIAYDEMTHRLFVVTRKPGKLLVLNADTGATLATFDAPARVDQLLWDAGDRRIYACGADGLGVYEQDSPDRYRDVGRVATPPASKTCIYVPSLRRLYFAASPGKTQTPAALVWAEVAARH